MQRDDFDAKREAGDLSKRPGSIGNASNSDSDESMEESDPKLPDDMDVDDSFSDISNDSDLFNVSVKADKTWTTRQDLELEAISRIAADLRDHPLLPPDPNDPNLDYVLPHAAMKLPPMHCAFKGSPRDEKMESCISLLKIVIVSYRFLISVRRKRCPL